MTATKNNEYSNENDHKAEIRIARLFWLIIGILLGALLTLLIEFTYGS